MHPGPGQLQMMRGFTSDSSVTKQQLKRGTVRRIAGYARPYRRQLAIRAVLGDPAYRNAACRVRDSFAAAGGATAAADHLEELL
jgi:UDP:flavonoid glycosyltransferase YjiC (YdhE family)